MLNLGNIEYFANLSFAGVQLLIPQGEIYSLEPSIDMLPNTENTSIGQFQQTGTTWLLYALSAELELLTHCPNQYRIVVLLKNVQPAYGLVCEQISTVASRDLNIQAIPTAMYNKNSPLLALALYGEDVLYISSALALSQLFN